MRWKVQGLFLLGRDFCSQVKSHTNIKNITTRTSFRLNITAQPQRKIKMCFHKGLGVKIFTLSHVLIATLNSLSLEKQAHFKTTQISFPFSSNIYLIIKWKLKYYQYSHKKGVNAITVKRTDRFCTDFSRRKQEKIIQITEPY